MAQPISIYLFISQGLMDWNGEMIIYYTFITKFCTVDLSFKILRDIFVRSSILELILNEHSCTRSEYTWNRIQL